jgi:hypothetical protein
MVSRKSSPRQDDAVNIRRLNRDNFWLGLLIFINIVGVACFLSLAVLLLCEGSGCVDKGSILQSHPIIILPILTVILVIVVDGLAAIGAIGPRPRPDSSNRLLLAIIVIGVITFCIRLAAYLMRIF